jgi:hypothetical protein
MEAPELTYGSAAADASGIIACKSDGIGSRFRRDAPVLVVLNSPELCGGAQRTRICSGDTQL